MHVLKQIHPRRWSYTTWLMAAILLILLIQSGVWLWFYIQIKKLPTVELSAVTLLARTDLCPGDTLDYQFTVAVTRPGVVDLHTSVLRRGDSENNTGYVRLQQFIMSNPTDMVIVRHWVVPPSYTDPETGLEVRWEPGLYAQRTTAVVSGRSHGRSTIEVQFSIRYDCTNLEEFHNEQPTDFDRVSVP